MQLSKDLISEENAEALAVVPYARLNQGFFHSVACNLVLFRDQILHATYTRQLLNQEVLRQQNAYEQEYHTPIRASKIHLGVSLHFYARYFDLSPAEILAEHAANFSIAVPDITRVWYQFDTREIQMPDRSRGLKPGKLTLETVSSKHVYSFSSIPAQELQKTLRIIWDFPRNQEDSFLWEKET